MPSSSDKEKEESSLNTSRTPSRTTTPRMSMSLHTSLIPVETTSSVSFRCEFCFDGVCVELLNEERADGSGDLREHGHAEGTHSLVSPL